MKIDKKTCLLFSGIIMTVCMAGSVALAQSQSPNYPNNSSSANSSPRKVIHKDQTSQIHNAEAQQNNDAQYNGDHNSAWPGGTHIPAGFERPFNASTTSGGSFLGDR